MEWYYDRSQFGEYCGDLLVEHLIPGLQPRSTEGKFSSMHGLRKTSEYRAWDSMLQRCTNPNNKNWDRYGGRGIQVAQEWQNSFEAFFSDMGPKPGPKYSIDRKDNDGPYCKGNCRWATHQEQCENRAKREGTSTHVGVCATKSGRWRAQIGTGLSKKHLGTFDTEDLAVEAIRKAKENA